MNASEDYPYADRKTARQYRAMCDEIDRLRAKAVAYAELIERIEFSARYTNNMTGDEVREADSMATLLRDHRRHDLPALTP